jgi:uncharacterized cupin superfamily protein
MPSFFHSKLVTGLLPAPIEPSWILEGTPIAGYVELSRSRDGTASTCLWDCTPGVFNWYYRNDETMHVVYGTVWLDKGLPSERLIGPGDVVFFPAGSQACWHVETYFLKVAWSRRPLPAIVVAPLNLLRKFKKW